MKKTKFIRKTLLWIGMAAVVIIAVIAVKAVSIYRQPLGPALDTLGFSEPTPIDLIKVTPTSAAADMSMPTPTPTIGQEKSPTRTVTTTGEKEPTAPTPTKSQIEICGETAKWNVLVIGSDTGDLVQPQGSDLTRVLHVDFQNKTVAIFAFSRDLWVDASNLNLANPSITNARLGMVFYEARLRSTKTDPQENAMAGINAIAKTLASNFGLESDHYIALDLDKLPTMVDTVGGVSINLPTGFTDPRSGMTFVAGEQTLNGMQTATYARAYLDTDLDRIERNNLLIMALRQKLLDPTIWVKIPELFTQFRDAVITDFSPEQVNHLACLLKEVREDAIIQEGVKAEWTMPGPEDSLLWDKPSVLNRLRELGMIP
jgi:LCP family protein required for cell wall assembly